MLGDGVTVEYRAAGGAIRGAQARAIDFDEPDANTWSAINQFTVTESGNTRRPDIVVFVNDLPLTGRRERHRLVGVPPVADLQGGVALVVRRQRGARRVGRHAGAYRHALGRAGVVQAVAHLDGQELAPAFYTELQVLIEGVFEKRRFLSLLRDFIVFEDVGGALVRKMAGYHQFHAVDLLRQPPVQAASRADPSAKLAVEAGGVVFTTIQEFFPEEGRSAPGALEAVQDRRHRRRGAPSQYDFIDGYARHSAMRCPTHRSSASPARRSICRTPTPAPYSGDCISVYDIRCAVEDKATVPIYYESRLAKPTLDERERPKIDPGFEEATEGEEVDRKEKLKTRWA